MNTPYYFTFPMSAPHAKDNTIITFEPAGDEMPPTNPNPPGGRTL